MQQTIRSAALDVYKDVHRMLPADSQPVCDERVMEIQPYVRPSTGRSKGGKSSDPVGLAVDK